MRGGRACGGVVAAVLVAALTVGCGDRNQAPARPAQPGYAPGVLNSVSVTEVLNAIDEAHLPALNPHDATAALCPTAGCTEARATDTVSILKFPSTGRAELYAATIPDMVQVEDIVLVFAAAVGDPQKQAYSRVAKRAIAHG